VCQHRTVETRVGELSPREDRPRGIDAVQISEIYCQTATLLGDLNCDGALNTFDIDPFVLALTNPAAYALQYPLCDFLLADMNADGAVNTFDIDPFVLALTGG